MSRFSMDWSELSLQVMITFGHFLWQACVVGVVLFVVQHVGEALRDSQIQRQRRNTKSNVSHGETDLRGANLRYAIACFAFFSLPICVAATFSWVHQSRGSVFLIANNPVGKLGTPAASENRSIPPLASNSDQVLGSLELPTEPLLTSTQRPFVEPIDKPVPSIAGMTWLQRAQAVAPYLLIAYAIGAGLLLSRFGISIIGSSRLRRTLQPITDSNLLKTIAEQSSRLGLKRVPIVAICQRVSVPVVVGIVKPMILLPPALLCGLDPNQLVGILSHEMAHIRRYDLIVNLLQRIVEALLFFHPVTWWISRRVSVERENCCDEVAAACAGRLSYASSLLQMAELCIRNDRRRMAALASLSADGGNTTDLGYRIRRLIGAEETTRVRVTRRGFAVGLTLLTLLMVSLVASGQNSESLDEKSEDETMPKIFTPEPLWQTKVAANELDNATDQSILWGEPVDGMRLGIRLSEFAKRRSPLRHGEHIDYEVWIKNETDEIVQIARDPRDLYSPRLMDDQSINVVGWAIEMSFMIPPEELAKAELILSPGEAAHRFPMPNHSASIRPPGSPRGRYGSEPLHLEPGKFTVYAQLGELKSGVEEVEIIPEATLQIRKSSRVTEKMREYAAQDPSDAILAWQSDDGKKQEAMVNWDHGVLVDEGDLASLEVVPMESQPDQFSILLHLRPESATWLARQIAAYSLWDDPDMVAILLDGKPLAAPRLNSSIADGKLIINGRFTKMEADEIAVKIRSAMATVNARNQVGNNEKIQQANLLGFWTGVLNGEPIMLSFHRSPVDPTVHCDLYRGRATIGMILGFQIAPDGASVTLLRRGQDPAEAIEYGRLTFGDNGTLQLAMKEKESEPVRVVLTRQPDPPNDVPQQEEPRKLFKLWKESSLPNGKIPGALIEKLKEQIELYANANPNLSSGMELPKLLPRFDASRDWTPAEVISLLDDVAYYSTEPIEILLALHVAGLGDHSRDAQSNNLKANSNWITSPQICVGKPYSSTAKAANWKWDEEQRVSLATPESGVMLTSVLPVADADFVVQAKVKGIDKAKCRLTMGESTFDVENSVDRTRLVVAGKEFVFDNDDKSREWTMLSLRRRDNKISIQVNEHPEVDLGMNAQAFGKISLQSARGTIAVSNFVVTGNVKPLNQPQEDSRGVSANMRKRSFRLVDGETGNPLQGLECQVVITSLNVPAKYRSCTSDEKGVVEVAFGEGEQPQISAVPSGWFSNSWYLDGMEPLYVVSIREAEQKPQGNAEPQNEEPEVLKLWRGTEVEGRLFWPDNTPAAGVKLTAGVYITDQSWKEKLGMDLNWYSFDHGDWPNWSRTIVTDREGRFRVTVPPKDSRWWFRIGTTQLGFGPQIGVGEDEAITNRLAKCVPLEIQYGGSSRGNVVEVPDNSDANNMILRAGDLQLETGIIVRGRVVDAQGNGLSNVHLTTTGPHGPHSGRSAISGEDGKFEFPAMAAGNLQVHPEARLRDDKGQVRSFDVQAVFIDQSFAIPDSLVPHEIMIRAVLHTEVEFEWVDRRADKGQPIALYGAFLVRGSMPENDGKPSIYWSSETERVERNGRPLLIVKIPTQLLKPELMLAADSKVTASYSDSTGVTSGPGTVQLGDITASTARTIFGDEPISPKSP